MKKFNSQIVVFTIQKINPAKKSRGVPMKVVFHEAFYPVYAGDPAAAAGRCTSPRLRWIRKPTILKAADTLS